MHKHILATVILMGSLLSVQVDSFSFKKDILAKINGEVITKKQFDYRINQLQPEQKKLFEKKENKLKLLDNMIDEEVLVLEAKKEKLHASEDYQQKLRLLERELLIQDFITKKINKSVTVNKEDVKEYYNANMDRFKKRPEYELSHVVVKTKGQAEKILKNLKKGASFKKAASTVNIDNTKENSGYLGWFSLDTLGPEISASIAKLKKNNQLSNVVQTKFGYHVFKRMNTRIKPKVAYSKVEKQLEQELIGIKRRETLAKVLDDAKSSIKIKRLTESL